MSYVEFRTGGVALGLPVCSGQNGSDCELGKKGVSRQRTRAGLRAAWDRGGHRESDAPCSLLGVYYSRVRNHNLLWRDGGHLTDTLSS